MHRIALLGASGLALLSMLGSARAQGNENASIASAPAVPAWTVCKAEGTAVRTDRGTRQTFYLSGVVPSAPDPAVGKGFTQFIEKKYTGKSMQRLPECWSSPTQAEAQDSIDKKVGASRWNIAYVATGWINEPASPAPEAAPQETPTESR